MQDGEKNRAPRVPDLEAMLDAAIDTGATPAASAVVIHRGAIVHRSSHGVDARGQPVDDECLFDLASVTKAVATTLCVAVLLERGELSLDATVRRFVPAFSGEGRDSVTVRELLAHGSGLPAWEPLFELVRADPVAGALFPGRDGDRAAAYARAREILERRVTAHRPGPERGARLYSDLGFILLGMVIEEVASRSLADAAAELVFAPLGVEDIGFVDLAGRSGGSLSLDGRRALPTGRTRPREPAPGQETLYAVPPQAPREDAGEVDDDNAWVLGGVAGHAGVFATATALARLGWLLVEELDGARRLGATVALSALTRRDEATAGTPRALGFDVPTGESSAAGKLLGRAGPLGAVGHLGFTGCSLWIDLDRELSVALLTNRTFAPAGRANVEGIRRLRPAFHDMVVRRLGLCDRC